MKLKIFKLNTLSLKKDHLNFYNENGYLVLRNENKKKEVVDLNKYISFFCDDDWHNIMNPDRLEFLLAQSFNKLKKIKNLTDKIDFINKAKLTSNHFKNYLTDKRVKYILEKLLKKKVVGLMSHVIFKHAKSKYAKLSWEPHQDNSYAKMKNNGYITTNLFIHKSNKKNGCLYIFPGSHKSGLLNYKKFYSYHAKSDQNPGNRVYNDVSKFNKIDLEIKEGDYLIMNGNLIHGSYGNFSKTLSRHMISFNYGIKNKKFEPGFTAQRIAIPF